MSQKLTIPKQLPIRADELPADWIDERRQIALRDGHAIRAGHGPWIEIQSINQPEIWLLLGRDGQGLLFVDTAERDKVLDQLHGRSRGN